MRILKYILTIFLSLSIYGQSAAQSKLSGNSGNKRSEIIKLINDAKEFYSTDAVKAIDLIEKALELSVTSNLKGEEAECFMQLGEINHIHKQYDLAINNFTKAISILRLRNDNLNLNKAYIKIADSYYNNKQYKEALDNYNKYKSESGNSYIPKRKKKSSVNKYRLLKESRKREAKYESPQDIYVKKRIAESYFEMNKDDSAYKQFKEVMQIEQKRENPKGVGAVQNSMGKVMMRRGQQGKALDYFKQSKQQAVKAKDKDLETEALSNIAKVYEKQNNIEEEIETRKEIVDIATQERNKEQLTKANLDLANTYIKNKKPEKALQYAKSTVKISKESENLEQQSNALKLMSNIYSKMGNYSKALKIYKDYVASVDKIYKLKEKELLDLNNKTKILRNKQQRINLLEKDIEIKNGRINLLIQTDKLNQQKSQTQTITIYSLIIILIILLTGSVLILRSSNQKRKANNLLALKSLRSQMNPHFIFNALNSVNSFISTNDERLANKYLSDFSMLMRTVLEKSQLDFIQLSTEIQILELYLKLEHFRFKDKFEYMFNIDESISTEEFQIPPMLIQPYIENAVWHGLRYKESMGTLKVKIDSLNNGIRIKVTDDGIGREKSKEIKTKNQKKTNSTALKNIDNRIRILNEVYKIDIKVSIDDLDKNNREGTVVTIDIPARNND